MPPTEGGLSDGLAHLEQLPRRPRPGCCVRHRTERLRRIPRFLRSHGHNFIRLWRWEQFKSLAGGGGFHLCMTPQPWPRSGPGAASDGKPRFDLSRFDQAYFDRLRARIIAAGNEGFYVSVMLFDGFCLIHCERPDNLAGPPFEAGNNVNEIGITSIKDDKVLPLEPGSRPSRRPNIRKVVDTVHDLPNVLYEVANESSETPPTELGDSTQWQYWVIENIKAIRGEAGLRQAPGRNDISDQARTRLSKRYADPSPGVRENAPLFEGPADWISPGFEAQLFIDPWYTVLPPTTDPRSSFPTPITTRRAWATPCGHGGRSCAVTTRS